MDCSPPDSSVHGSLQARILEWVALPFSRGSSQPRDGTSVSCIAGGFLTIHTTWEAQIHVYVKLNPFAGHLKHNMVNQRYSNEKKKIKRIHQHVEQLAQKN